MNRYDFFSKLNKLFADVSNVLLDGYKEVLTDCYGNEINYDKLYEILLAEYKWKKAPMPAWFAGNLHRVKTHQASVGGEYLIDRKLAWGEARIIAKNLEEGWMDIKILSPKDENGNMQSLGVYRFYHIEKSNAYMAREGL